MNGHFRPGACLGWTGSESPCPVPIRLGPYESRLSKGTSIHAPFPPIALQPDKGCESRSTRSHSRTPQICRLQVSGWLNLAVSEQSGRLMPWRLLSYLFCHGSGQRNQGVTKLTLSGRPGPELARLGEVQVMQILAPFQLCNSRVSMKR